MRAIFADQVMTMGPQGTIEDAVLLLEEGKIKEVGSREEIEVSSDWETLDFSGARILPGLIDAHTHLGVHEDGEGWEGQDTNELTDPTTPQVRGLDGANPFDLGFQDAVAAGVTTVNLGPGSGNVIGGQFVAVKTVGGPVLDDRVIRQPTGMKMATGENPKRVYGERDSMPSTRLGTAATLRKALFEVQDYVERRAAAEEKDEAFKKDFSKEALIPVLRGELKAKIHAHRADDIATAIRIAEEFGLDYSIDHCTEGHKIADFLAEEGADAVVGPGLVARVKREVIERTFETPGALSEAGVRVAITTDSPVVPIQYLPLMAAFAVREGMKEEDALRAITINSAEIVGIEDRVGSLEEGKDADFLVMEGSPFEVKSYPTHVFVDGEEVDREGLPQLSRPRVF